MWKVIEHFSVARRVRLGTLLREHHGLREWRSRDHEGRELITFTAHSPRGVLALRRAQKLAKRLRAAGFAQPPIFMHCTLTRASILEPRALHAPLPGKRANRASAETARGKKEAKDRRDLAALVAYLHHELRLSLGISGSRGVGFTPYGDLVVHDLFRIAPLTEAGRQADLAWLDRLWPQNAPLGAKLPVRRQSNRDTEPVPFTRRTRHTPPRSKLGSQLTHLRRGFARCVNACTIPRSSLVAGRRSSLVAGAVIVAAGIGGSVWPMVAPATAPVSASGTALPVVEVAPEPGASKTGGASDNGGASEKVRASQAAGASSAPASRGEVPAREDPTLSNPRDTLEELSALRLAFIQGHSRSNTSAVPHSAAARADTTLRRKLAGGEIHNAVIEIHDAQLISLSGESARVSAVTSSGSYRWARPHEDALEGPHSDIVELEFALKFVEGSWHVEQINSV